MREDEEMKRSKKVDDTGLRTGEDGRKLIEDDDLVVIETIDGAICFDLMLCPDQNPTTVVDYVR